MAGSRMREGEGHARKATLVILIWTFVCVCGYTSSTAYTHRNPLRPRPLVLMAVGEGSTSPSKLPVTVLSGFLGSGKTTLLKNLLEGEREKRFAVIVNDMSSINIDAQVVKHDVMHQPEELVEISDGCICCTLREDLLREVRQIAEQKRFDHLIIESTGISEPFPVAETFLFESDDGLSLDDVAEIDTLVTVVDSYNFLRDFKEGEELRSRNMSAGDDDQRSVTDLLVNQVEFANLIILNKRDLVTDEEMGELRGIIRSLNADAKVVETTHSKVNPDLMIGARGFDFDAVSQSATWLKVLEADIEQKEVGEKKTPKKPETEEYGVNSFVFHARKPFHPLRLWDFIKRDLPETGLIRSKGWFWLASHPSLMMMWAHAGGIFNLFPAGYWWVDTPEEEWPEEDREEISLQMENINGDRRQELVLIGIRMDTQKVQDMLNSCLLTDEEMNAGPAAWYELEDPFPDFSTVMEENEFDSEEEEGVDVELL